MPSVLVVFVLSLGLIWPQLILHEVFHVLIARLLKIRITAFKPFPHFEGDLLYLGRVSVEKKQIEALSNVQQSFIYGSPIILGFIALNIWGALFLLLAPNPLSLIFFSFATVQTLDLVLHLFEIFHEDGGIQSKAYISLAKLGLSDKKIKIYCTIQIMIMAGFWLFHFYGIIIGDLLK